MRTVCIVSILTVCVSFSALSQRVVIAPTSGTTTLGSYPTLELSKSYDQSGLSQPYSSWVTDFDTYVALNPQHDTHLSPPTGSFFGGIGFTPPQYVTYDLGSQAQIDGLVLWNVGQDYADTGVKAFSLSGSTDAAFSAPIDLGSYTAAIGPANGPSSAQVFPFALVAIKYVKMQIESNYGNTGGYVGFGEATFRGIPEPSSSMLMLVALPALVWRMRQRR